MAVFKKIMGIIMISCLFFSCKNKKPNAEVIEQQEPVSDNITTYSYPKPVPDVTYESLPEDISGFFQTCEYEPVPEEICDILYKNEKRYLEGWFTAILYIHRANFGIPGGDNYIVLWRYENRGSYETYVSNDIVVYSISDKIENRYSISTGIGRKAGDYNILKNIPGIHIKEAYASFCDFNGDGKDELFSYGFYGMGYYIEFHGYDAEENKIKNYCDDVKFDIIDEDTAPLVFTRYKNKLGFKVYSTFYSKMPPVNLIDDYYAWYFFAWNNDTKQYENLGEYPGGGADVRYNLHDYDIEHFKNRLRLQAMSNMEVLKDLEEINAKIQGGRSFRATIMAASSKEYFEEIYNFDADGILVY
jgi:hypothetical protein